MAMRLFFTMITAIAGINAASLNCSTTAIPTPSLFGAEIKSLTAAPARNFSIFAPQAGASPSFNTNFTGLDFCNVTVTYTHPGRNDTIKITVWLPLQNWNGRFQGAGGGGWVMGNEASLAPAVAKGYAVAASDGGHSDVSDAAAAASHWALISPGNVNLGLLQDFASTGLRDLAIVGKAVTESFYGTKPKYSYWAGCSTGGRQGLMLAQRYPDLFDGIIADSPAIDWDKLPISTYWSQLIANKLNYHPPLCELDSISAEAIKVCDRLDGVVDGVVSSPDLCNFNATWAVGKPATLCNGTNQTITAQAAQIANSVWSGPVTPDGTPLWHGLERGSQLMGLANTTCNGTSACIANPLYLGPQWLTYFLAKDPDFNPANMTNTQYYSMFRQSTDEYASIIGTSFPDLSDFRAHGGKMITVHGTADQLIPHRATAEYYRSVLSLDPNASDFYRFFEAPGDGHCGLGLGHHANDTLGQLVRWVEGGEAPETLVAVSQNGDGTEKAEGERTIRRLCAWPKKQTFVGGDPGIDGINGHSKLLKHALQAETALSPRTLEIPSMDSIVFKEIGLSEAVAPGTEPDALYDLDGNSRQAYEEWSFAEALKALEVEMHVSGVVYLRSKFN
ncbi:hypothetical protein PRZ48_011061 [Zasmidium cellare]|uniref:Carboxylic ester hydrolase n=1 Tax=Zasmidium cellare TaxID=395010 RepID=A0ABR0EB92_ZASCE|nr:hypothetical protein PRZ48_011061 [Zasmidium cellare]